MYPNDKGPQIMPWPGPYCPKCGGTMRLVTPSMKRQNMFDPFWGCTLYPLCKGTRNCDPYTGAALLTLKEIDEKRAREYLEAVNSD